MAKTLHPALGRLKKARVCLQGKFDRGERERLAALVEAQGGEVVADLDVKTTHLVLPDLASGATIQKKAEALRKKGAAVEIVDTATFLKTANPIAEELVALLKDGKRGERGLAGVAPFVAGYRNYHDAAPGSPILVGAKLDGVDLSGLDLRGIAFKQCTFVGATLEGAKFAEAIECDFSKAVGESPELAKINCSRFANARLKNATFCSHLHGADFTGAKLENCKFNEQFWGSRVEEEPSTKGPCFDRADLRGSGFDQVWAQGASFDKADLTGVAFGACRLDGASFRNATAREVLFVANYLNKADFSNCSLVGANLAEAELAGVMLDGADLTDANLRGAKIKQSELKGIKGFSADAVKTGQVGAALTELDAVFRKARSVEISFRVGTDVGSGGYAVQIAAYPNFSSMFLPGAHDRIQPRPQGTVPFSQEILLAGRVFGHLPVRFESLSIKSTKAPKSGKELRDLIMQGIAEAFAQPLPGKTDPAAAAQFRKQQRDAAAAKRQEREQAQAQAAKEKQKATKQIAKKIAKAVGKVNDVASFLKALELRIEKPKIDKATSMLKASGFKLFNDVTEVHVSGVVKSQTDPDLVYACRVAHDGQYSCCTQNLNVCGGLRGSICKHLLVLIIGLVQAGEVDPTTIDAWIAKTHGVKPELDKEDMGAVFIKYKGAEAGEVDWRPTETVPEDYYAL